MAEAWLDLRFLQVWAGDLPLGYLNKAGAAGMSCGSGRHWMMKRDPH